MSSITTSRLLTRSSSATAARMSSKWCGAIRVTTTSKAPSSNGMCSAGRQHVRPHPRRWVERDHLGPELAQPPRDVAAAGRDVECLDALGGLAPLDHEVEVGALAMARALAVRLGALRPGAHAASSTARLAASSIVASTCRFGGAASARISRPSSAFVPSKRTTIGCRISICVERLQDPARHHVAARDPGEDVEQDRLAPAGRP